ncbi:MAG TPA: hypothetical protein VGX70_23730, partial [Gemmataceae bacterium]|nr:hypothetical protein [Gemmataceae bacterium]
KLARNLERKIRVTSRQIREAGSVKATESTGIWSGRGVEPTTARDLKANTPSKLESVDIDLPFVTRSLEG